MHPHKMNTHTAYTHGGPGTWNTPTEDLELGIQGPMAVLSVCLSVCRSLLHFNLFLDFHPLLQFRVVRALSFAAPILPHVPPSSLVTVLYLAVPFFLPPLLPLSHYASLIYIYTLLLLSASTGGGWCARVEDINLWYIYPGGRCPIPSPPPTHTPAPAQPQGVSPHHFHHLLYFLMNNMSSTKPKLFLAIVPCYSQVSHGVGDVLHSVVYFYRTQWGRNPNQ